MRITLLLLLALAACAAPARQDDPPPAIPSGPTLSIGGGVSNYYGTSR
jgi:hypothetical protein